MAKEPSAPNLPHSLAKMKAALDAFRPPSGPFDPHGIWDHRYAVWIVLPESNFGKAQPMGALQIRRQPAGENAATLDVILKTTQGVRTSYRAEARIACAADRLSTPTSWELKSVILDFAGKPVPGADAQETGRVEQGIIHRKGKVERTLPAPKAFTSNWSLFDAVQRFPGNEIEPMNFDMFEELGLFKPNQRLSFKQSIELELGGARVRLHGFQQLGEGILPYHYWLDDQRRLLIAVGGLRAFVFDSSAQA